jgi:low temperature requirement protein LtrA
MLFPANYYDAVYNSRGTPFLLAYEAEYLRRSWGDTWTSRYKNLASIAEMIRVMINAQN